MKELNRMRVAVLANLKKNAPTWEGMLPDQWDDLDSEKTIHSLIGALNCGGHQATFLEGDLSLVENLQKLQPDICFNICEGHFGDARESQVPALLEMMRIPYTGSRVMALALALDKPMTNRILAYHGLPTPPFQVFERADEAIDSRLIFPLFVKPSREGTGMGVTVDSIVYDEPELRAKVHRIINRYQQPALVERFIDGREVTVGLVGNFAANRVAPGEEIHVFPPIEIDMALYPAEEGGIYSNRLKVELADDFHITCPAPLHEAQTAELKRLTSDVFQVIGCHDVARVDFRLDANDHERPYILEINPLPGLNPGYSDLCLEAETDGWSYEQLINRILHEASQRFGIC